jgi:hypothetical protein
MEPTKVFKTYSLLSYSCDQKTTLRPNLVLHVPSSHSMQHCAPVAYRAVWLPRAICHPDKAHHHRPASLGIPESVCRNRRAFSQVQRRCISSTPWSPLRNPGRRCDHPQLASSVGSQNVSLVDKSSCVATYFSSARGSPMDVRHIKYVHRVGGAKICRWLSHARRCL